MEIFTIVYDYVYEKIRTSGLEEEAALFFGDRKGEPLHGGEEILPDLAFLGEVLVAEEIAGMKGGADGNPVEFQPAAAQTGDGGLLRAKESLHGGGAEGDDDLGCDDGDLSAEVRKTGVHLVAGGFAVATGVGRHVRAALEDIGDVNLGAGELHGRDHLGEKLAGFTDERLTLLVLVGAGSLTDKHQFCFRIAHTEDHLGAGFGEVGADGAGGGFFS